MKGENKMLKENLKTLRKNKGLSQEELSVKLNVVRQTISKWEQGLSVPDAEMLVSISKEFDTSVSELLGENISKQKENSLKEISEKLEVINLQLIQRKEHKRKVWHWIFIYIKFHNLWEVEQLQQLLVLQGVLFQLHQSHIYRNTGNIYIQILSFLLFWQFQPVISFALFGTFLLIFVPLYL